MFHVEHFGGRGWIGAPGVNELGTMFHVEHFGGRRAGWSCGSEKTRREMFHVEHSCEKPRPPASSSTFLAKDYDPCFRRRERHSLVP